MTEPKPHVLLVYYSHTNQAARVCDSMARTLRERGCDVTQAGIEFTDPKYSRSFATFPFKNAVLSILPLFLPQTFRRTGEFRVAEAAQRGDYELVCFGSPTWFFTTNMPLRSYLKAPETRVVLEGKPFAAYVVCRRYWGTNMKEVRKLASAQGGTFVGGIRFAYEGGQIRSLLALLSYFGAGEMRQRALGIKIPPTNLKPDFGDEATAFANKLADGIAGSPPAVLT